jgi:hypothetical protein
VSTEASAIPNFSHHHSIVPSTFGVDAATITFSYPSDQLFPFAFVHPLSLSARTIGFFDSPNLYYRSYLAVSQHCTFPPSSIVIVRLTLPMCARPTVFETKTTEKPLHILISAHPYLLYSSYMNDDDGDETLQSSLLSALPVYGTVHVTVLQEPSALSLIHPLLRKGVEQQTSSLCVRSG